MPACCLRLFIVLGVGVSVTAGPPAKAPQRQIQVLVRGQVTPAVVRAGAPIPLTVTVTNNLPGTIRYLCYSLTPSDWNGETRSVGLVDIYRDGTPGSLHLAIPKITPPLQINGLSSRRIEAGKSLQFQTDARKWTIRDGWRPGHYRVTLRVYNLRADRYCTLSVLSDRFEFQVK